MANRDLVTHCRNVLRLKLAVVFIHAVHLDYSSDLLRTLEITFRVIFAVLNGFA